MDDSVTASEETAEAVKETVLSYLEKLGNYPAIEFAVDGDYIRI